MQKRKSECKPIREKIINVPLTYDTGVLICFPSNLIVLHVLLCVHGLYIASPLSLAFTTVLSSTASTRSM